MPTAQLQTPLSVLETQAQEDGSYLVRLGSTEGLQGLLEEGQSVSDFSFARYLLNPLVLYEHNDWYTGQVMGTTLEIGYEEASDSIMARFRFIELLPDDLQGRRVQNEWEQGALRGASMGWIRGEDGKLELIEWSIVKIPYDMNALRVAALARYIQEQSGGSIPLPTGVVEASTETGKGGIAMPEMTPDQVGQQINTALESFRASLGDQFADVLAQHDQNRTAAAAEAARQEAAIREDERAKVIAELGENGGGGDGTGKGGEADEAAAGAAEAQRQLEAEQARQTEQETAAREAVKARTALIASAAPFLKDDFDPHSHSDEEILRAALGDRVGKDATVPFMAGMLAALASAKQADEVVAAGNRNRYRGNGAATNDDDSPQAQAASARADYIASLETAYLHPSEKAAAATS